MFECYENDLFGLICLYIFLKVLFTLPEWQEVNLYMRKTDLELFGFEQLRVLLFFFLLLYSIFQNEFEMIYKDVGKQNIKSGGRKNNKHGKKARS